MKKIGLLALALVLAVGTMGIGFAHWSGTLDISGSVQTSDVCVGWYDFSGGDPGISIDELYDLGTGTHYAGTQHIGTGTMAYNLTSLLCTAVVPPGTVPLPHYRTLTVNISNAYPYYYVDWEIHLHNCGTLPVNVSAAIIDAPPELAVTCPDGILPAKVHPCESIVWSLIVWCKQPSSPTATDGVQPGQSYSFNVTINWEQAQ